jgi:hypothetical protein
MTWNGFGVRDEFAPELQNSRTPVLQIAELEIVDGKMVCDRDNYARLR